ncbi:hypothetical protein CC86DRAFT_442377 [Ophiobolus disseminans]|uniref:AA9 family lytic polysaccharide monooxygenase n=1 Tax=Ophiobolus disseminans TaxID=1469910 RepID=A0A6A7AH02_9PLEO|nr:hypothetical protein CC86DRAFT_442377 [Ophiobolus disseminans]
MSFQTCSSGKTNSHRATTFALAACIALARAATCARLPTSNGPVTDVTSDSIRCNVNQGPAASKCSVAAGGTVTIEMHQQNNGRSCTNDAIRGSHWGPVIVYMSKVADAATADGSSSFFKIFQDTWAKKDAYSLSSDDYWGTKDLNANCAQFYLTCYQIKITDWLVSGSSSTNPVGVFFPGAYNATDPGIRIIIRRPMATYDAPGPAVMPGGTEAVAGKAGSVVAGTAGASKQQRHRLQHPAMPDLYERHTVGNPGLLGAPGSTCHEQSGYPSQCV